MGWQSSSILKPLLQQGLSDTEEFVIYKALNALTCMCQLGLLQKPHIYEFVSDIGNVSRSPLYFHFRKCHFFRKSREQKCSSRRLSVCRVAIELGLQPTGILQINSMEEKQSH